ncbi:MAG: hypothetical protein D8M59_16575 [Planctomycetes bacterium]|nr:hypothetical protein [Planctomycetota bacterium]
MLIDGGSLAMMLGDRALPDADQMAVELACEAVDRHANFVLLAEMARSVDFGPLVRALIASNRPLSVVCVGESAEESVQQNLEGILAPWCDSSIVRNIFLLSETGAFQELEATPGAKLRQAVAHLLSAQRSAEAVPEELENQAPNPSTAEVVAASPPAGVPGDTPVDDDADEFVEVSSGGRVTRIRRPKRKSPKTVSKAATAVAATTSAITDASPASSPPKQPPMPPQPPTTPAPAVPVDESAVRRRREQIDRIKKRNASS